MSILRRNRQKRHCLTAKPFVYVYKGKRYTFYALNTADAMTQVRENLSAQAAREGFML